MKLILAIAIVVLAASGCSGGTPKYDAPTSVAPIGENAITAGSS